jgi:hypothetical protein
MLEVTALKIGKQLEIPKATHAPFLKLTRNECMATMSGGGKMHAHLQTLA